MKNRVFIMLVIITLKIISSPVLASNNGAVYEMNVGSIVGKIVDETSGTPIEYASIVLYKSEDSSLVTGTTSDLEGNFKIEKIENGIYFLKITFIGFKDMYLNDLEISKNKKSISLGLIKISQTSTQINEVVVAGEKSRIQYKIDKRVIEVDKDITAKGGSAINVLENTPSVQVDPQGNLTLRGSSDYVVLVDGKPSILKGNDALKQIPSSSIKQIEVITNPSAKYEADGHAGIINIISKKEKMQGLSGNISFGYGNTNKQNGNALLNYRKGKVNFFTGVDYADNIYSNTVDLNNATFLTTETQYTKQNTNQFNTNQNLNFKGGMDFDLNEKNALSISGNIGRQGYDHGSDANTNLFSSTQDYNLYSKSSNYMDVAGDVKGLSIDYTHKFADDHKISINSNYSDWIGLDDNNLKEWKTNQNYEEESILSMINFTKENKNYQYRANLDYSRPILKGTFESGVQFRYENRKEDFLFRNYNLPEDIWNENVSLSYYLKYLNSIYSGYATYSNKKWGIGYQIGLRSEYFMRSIDIDTEEKPLEYNKFMFYPSLHFSKDFNDKNSMQLSYSRRINRPQPWLLNNTPSFIDARNIFKGSPYLIPEFTDAIELNYRSVIKKLTVSIQTYFKNTTNPFTALRLLENDGIMYHQLTNAKNQQSFGAEFGLDLNLLKWWQINTNSNIYNYKLKTLVSNTDKIQEVLTWDARFVNSFSLKWGTKIQAVAYYSAPSVDAMGDVSGYFTTNFAISQPLLKGKASIGLSAQNLVNSTEYTYSVQTEKFNNNYQIAYERPIFILNLSYNFNNYQSKNRGRRDDIDFKGGGGF